MSETLIPTAVLESVAGILGNPATSRATAIQMASVLRDYLGVPDGIEGWVHKNTDYHELGSFFGREEYIVRIRDGVRRAILFVPAEADDE